jgi:ABC-2 type transport system ATP-binding protein
MAVACLSVENVTKVYPGGTRALNGVSFEARPGGVLGLLGPNGAGKSTLMRILATVTRPTTGRVVWNGADVTRRPNRVRRVLGYLPQDFGVYANLNVREFLRYMAAAKGVSAGTARLRIEELIDVVGLRDHERTPLGRYSGGMRQRVGFAQAIMSNPQLLIMDEPTVGLDPEERANVRELISELAAERVVLLSTHVVSDLEASAADIIFIHAGSIVAHASPQRLIEQVEGKVWRVDVGADELPALQSRCQVSASVRTAAGFTARVLAAGPPDDRAQPVAANLEDAYLYQMAHVAAAPALASS